uniref:Uncharacterized protein n=1 Tax=Romanomermis culicivorax TaxID=13658 RepID=A0A915JND5_ROMCU
MSFEHLLSRKPSSSWYKKNSSSSPIELYTSNVSLQQQNEKLFTIAVVGINRESEQKLGRGVGKSCKEEQKFFQDCVKWVFRSGFCNRIVKPHADSYQILQNLCKTKKPILIVTSKNDELSLDDVSKCTKLVEKVLSSRKEFK